MSLIEFHLFHLHPHHHIPYYGNPCFLLRDFLHHRPIAMHVPVCYLSVAMHLQSSVCKCTTCQYIRSLAVQIGHSYLVTVLPDQISIPVIPFSQSTRAISFPVIPSHTLRYSSPESTSFSFRWVVSEAVFKAISALPSPLKSYAMKGEYQTPGSIPCPKSLDHKKCRHLNKPQFDKLNHPKYRAFRDPHFFLGYE